MKPAVLICAVLFAGSMLAGQAQQPPPRSPQSQQPTDVAAKISGSPRTPTKIAIAGIIPLSSDSETGGRETIADVLYDDIAYEREFYAIGKGRDRDDSAADVRRSDSARPWRELTRTAASSWARGKTANGVTVQVKLSTS
jgi:hypothetical protein